jgi:hypothetical protein
MDSFQLRLFQSEVALQCRFVLFGFEQYQQIDAEVDAAHARVSERERVAPPFERGKVWREGQKDLPDRRTTDARRWLLLQTIVVSAANLSKLLWGTGRNKDEAERREAERKPLRDSVGVHEDSCLRSRHLRNDFEHFDERIECRFSDPDRRRGFVGRNIGGGPGNVEPFGHYNPETGDLTFWMHTVNVCQIVEEAERILPRAEAESLKS